MWQWCIASILLGVVVVVVTATTTCGCIEGHGSVQGDIFLCAPLSTNPSPQCDDTNTFLCSCCERLFYTKHATPHGWWCRCPSGSIPKEKNLCVRRALLPMCGSCYANQLINEEHVLRWESYYEPLLYSDCCSNENGTYSGEKNF